jgi:hypothetical protein
MATLRPPESNDGAWIVFAERRWTLNGIAVPFEESAFEHNGNYAAFPIFKRRTSTKM